MNKPEFLILSGDGINCERETARAFDSVGGKGKIVHVNDLLKNPSMLKVVQGMAIPGGFSFGDELGSGQVLALKIRHSLYQEFYRFVDNRRPIIGICNGFQTLAKLGLLPNYQEERCLALAPNTGGRFIDRWVDIRVEKNACIWTNSLSEKIRLPIRHGEGRVMFPVGRERQIYSGLEESGQIPLRYDLDINGSYGRIAGLCDPTGVILGLMPHPEAALFNATADATRRDFTAPSYGYAIFKNIVDHLNES